MAKKSKKDSEHNGEGSGQISETSGKKNAEVLPKGSSKPGRKRKTDNREPIEILAEEAEESVVRLFAMTVADTIHPDKYYSFGEEADYLFASIAMTFILKKMDPYKRVDIVIELFKILEDAVRGLTQEEFEEIDCELADLTVKLSIELSSIYDDENDFGVRQKLLDSCMTYLSENRAYDDEVEDVILDYDDPRFFDRLTPFVDKYINEYPNGCNIGEYVACKLTILSKEGYSIEQLKEYASKFKDDPFIHSWFIDYYKKEGNLSKALEVLEDYSQRWKFKKDYIQGRIDELILHFKNASLIDQVIAAYLRFIKRSPDSEIKYYKELKECIPAPNWEKYREEIFILKKDSTISIAMYLAEENLLDHLEELVFNPQLNIELFDILPNAIPSEKEHLEFTHLKDLIQLLVKREEYEKVLDLYKALALQSSQDETVQYKAFKSLFSKSQWEEFREKVFDWRKDSFVVLAGYFKEDKLYDRLVEVLVSPKANLKLLNEFAGHLPQKYEDKIYEKYLGRQKS